MKTVGGYDISTTLVSNHLGSLVNKFYKILPMWESNEPSLSEFMDSLRVELFGYKNLMRYIQYDASYMTLLSILQYLIDHINECELHTVRREVFKAISICKKLRKKYCTEEA